MVAAVVVSALVEVAAAAVAGFAAVAVAVRHWAHLPAPAIAGISRDAPVVGTLRDAPGMSRADLQGEIAVEILPAIGDSPEISTADVSTVGSLAGGALAGGALFTAVSALATRITAASALAIRTTAITRMATVATVGGCCRRVTDCAIAAFMSVDLQYAIIDSTIRSGEGRQKCRLLLVTKLKAGCGRAARRNRAPAPAARCQSG